jgi:hypothetical protein
MSEREDRKVKKVVVPVIADTQTIHHRVSGNLKHISIVTGISAGGPYLTPYIVSSQISGSVQQAPADTGFQFGKLLILPQRTKTYVNGSLFRDSIQRVFIHFLTILCQREEFTEEQAALLMDNCPWHVKREFLGIVTAASVRISIFAPHTTHLF